MAIDDNKKNDCDAAKEKYDKAVRNPDITTPEMVAELMRKYQTMKAVLDRAQAQLKEIEIDKNSKYDILLRLKNEKSQLDSDIARLKTDILDLKLRQPVWVEGYGEATLSEDKTPLQCSELALSIAKRDAIEKGGKAIIESVTQVEMLELVKDSIKLSSKVQVLEQDESQEYGKVKRIISGDTIKFAVTVRLKVQSIANETKSVSETIIKPNGTPKPIALKPVTPKPNVNPVLAGTINLDGDSTYIGEISNGQPHGYGTQTYPDGRKYEGEFKNGKRNGKGTFTWPSGSKYVGQFKDGARNGKGTYTWPDGQKYVGEFKDGARSGKGIYTWPNGQRYEGEHRNDKRNGQGTMVWANGDRYVGEWKDGERSGFGSMFWGLGDKYEGEWKNDKMHGRGIYTSVTGKQAKGEWKNGEQISTSPVF